MHRRRSLLSAFGKRLSLLNTNASVYYDALTIPELMTTGNESVILRGLKSNVVDAQLNDTSMATYAGLGVILASTPTAPSGIETSTSADLDKSASKAPVSAATYENILRYAKFSSAAYLDSCSMPNGATLVEPIRPASGIAITSGSASAASVYGIVARDDENKEIIVAIRGNPSMAMLAKTVTKGQGASLVDATSSIYDLGAPTGTLINQDLLEYHESLSLTISRITQSVLATHSDYGITFVGHGTGGALAVLSAVAHIKKLGPKVPIQSLTYGAPRIGNAIWSAYADSLLLTKGNARLLRITHQDDNVAQALAQSYGYQHAGIELYQKDDITGAAGVVQCAGIEDTSCNNAAYSTDAYVAPNNGGISNTTPITSADSNQAGQATQSSSTFPEASPISTSSQETSPTNPVIVQPTSSTSMSTPTTDRPAAIACSLCTSLDCIDCIEDSSTGTLSVASDALPPVVNMDAVPSVPVPITEQISTVQPSTNSLSVDTGDALMAQQIGPISQTNAVEPAAKQSSNPISAFFSSVVDRISNIFSRDLHPSAAHSPDSSSSILASPTKRAATFNANSAHLTYLGIVMTQAGDQYCQSQSTSSSTTASTTPIPSTVPGSRNEPSLIGSPPSAVPSASTIANIIPNFAGSTLLGLTSDVTRCTQLSYASFIVTSLLSFGYAVV